MDIENGLLVHPRSVGIKPGDTARFISQFEKLKQRFPIASSLAAKWVPDETREVAGEVKSGTIYVYDEDISSAIRTLAHEVLDYVVSQAIEPYKQVINALVRLLNDQAYSSKERVVESIVVALDLE
jgi:hypothetical protein